MRWGFLLYDSRSGSTYFAAVLNSYNSIEVSQESAFATRIMEMDEKWIGDAPAIVAYLKQEIQFQELTIDEALLRSKLTSAVDKHEIIAAVVECLFANKQAEYCLVKHPPLNHLDQLDAWFGGLTNIHIVRDGRGVHNSKKNSISIAAGRSMSSSVRKSSTSWMKHLKSVEALRSKVIRVRYEALIEDQSATMDLLLDELNIEDRSIGGSAEAYHGRIGQRQQTLHKNVSSAPDADIATKWKRSLTQNEIALYEHYAGKKLLEYGYPLVSSDAHQSAPIAFTLFKLTDLVKYGSRLAGNALRSLFVLGDFRQRLSRRLRQPDS